MSLVLAAVYPTAVIVVTDSISYTAPVGDPNDEGFVPGTTAWTTKAHPLLHLDAVLTGAGISEVSAAASWIIDQLPSSVTDIDEAANYLPGALADVWRRQPGDAEHDGARFSNITLAGWSPDHGAMVAYRFASANDFALESRTDGLGLWPFPVDPTGIRPPATEQDWVDLAEYLRAEQIAQPHPVLIGGHLVLTVLERGVCTQRVIHTFDDSPDLWKRYLGGAADRWQLPTPMPPIPRP